MTEEGRVSSTLGWFRTAKDKFRAFAYGEQSEPRERPRVGLALAGGFARGIAHLGVLRVLRDAGPNGQGWRIHELHGFRPLDAVLARTSHQPAHGKISRAFYSRKNFRGIANAAGHRHHGHY